MERTHRKRRRLAFGDSKGIVGHEVERAVDDVERTADVAKPLERHVVSRIEACECARVAVLLGPGHAQERPYQPAAIHAVQRELVDRDDASKARAYRKETKEREKILGQRRACGVRHLVEETEIVDELEQQAVGVRDEDDQQDRRHRRSQPQGDRARDAPLPGLCCQRRDQPVGGATRSQREKAQPDAAAALREPKCRKSGVERERTENRNPSRHEPRQADDEDPCAGARPPLAIVVRHVATGEADEDRDLQEEEEQRGRQIDDDEYLRIVLRQPCKEMMCP